MTYREQLRWLAFDHHGVVTIAQARAIGVPAVALRKLASRHVLRHFGHGVYLMEEAPTTPLTEYALALALVGPDAMLADESVLAAHELALVNPRTIKVTTPRRVRTQVPKTVEIIRRSHLAEPAFIGGLPAMPVGQALVECKGRVPKDRLVEAAQQARAQGLLPADEADDVLRTLLSA